MWGGYLNVWDNEVKVDFLVMNFARKRDWRNIIINNDSSVVIATITIHQDDNLIFGNIITHIHALADCFDCLPFQHIRRCGNIATRRRARLSPKDHRSFVFLSELLPKDPRSFVFLSLVHFSMYCLKLKKKKSIYLSKNKSIFSYR